MSDVSIKSKRTAAYIYIFNGIREDGVDHNTSAISVVYIGIL